MLDIYAVRPTTKFAKLGNDRVGYQVLGQGPIDLVFLTGMSSHIDLRWEEPLNEYFLHRLASFSRLILFDRRGAGVSDAVPSDHLPTWEEWADDMRVVLDTVASERAAIMAWFDGGPMAMLFAATYPERTAALVLAHTAARYVRADDYPQGFAPDVAERLLQTVAELWGTDGFAAIAAPSRSHDEGFRQPSHSVSDAGPQSEWIPDRHDGACPLPRGAHPGCEARRAPGDRRGPRDRARRRDPGQHRRVPEPHPRWDCGGSLIRDQVARFQGRVIESTGDGVLATFDRPGRAIRAAGAIQESMGTLGIDLRAGLHAGEIELREGGHRVGGIAVHIAARVLAMAVPGEILVSSPSRIW